MKKIVLLIIITLVSVSFCNAQEWFKSIDVAKRLALVQDKMLFVIWEESLDYPYPISYITNSGDLVFLDLSKDNSLDTVIWEYFIPVLLSESEYNNLLSQADGRGARYIAKLNDESIKIMDANKNILNVEPFLGYEQNLSELIKNYSLRTTFIRQDLINYSQQKNFTTTFNLASKYIDFSIFVEKEARNDIMELANIYFEEAKQHLSTSNLENKEAYLQRIDLLMLKEDLVLDNPRRALRFIKRMDEKEIEEVNRELFYFLNYTAYKLLKDENEAALFQTKISEADLKRAELIYNINN